MAQVSPSTAVGPAHGPEERESVYATGEGSSSHDLMMAAPAIANGGGASSTAAGAMGLRTGYITVTEACKALQ